MGRAVIAHRGRRTVGLAIGQDDRLSLGHPPPCHLDLSEAANQPMHSRMVAMVKSSYNGGDPKISRDLCV